ncbi:helix-turn-helix transcriptional regulator [Senegalia sp. (in: firmicutes)]|uniref:helix-turn-helix transcriptional regulator n=1 Tax=Senegalia sp. (in: firmicutes) TaxID=1924098 RepID=UPI003F9945B1
MSKDWIGNYQKLVFFLGKALGENYEVVLHVLEDEDSYIGAIVNNHISGRSEGAPLTNLALQKLKEGDYKRNDSILNYKVLVKDGKTIHGSTFYIKSKDGNILGLLCINADYSKHRKIIDELLTLTNIDIQSFSDEKFEEYDNNHVEILSADIEEIIKEVIDPVLLDSRVTLNKETRLDIIETLENKGVFQLKGAISKVAKLLNISEPTIYRNLQEIKKLDR